jgi:hypothetical protein
VISFPSWGKEEGFHKHRFVVPGLRFDLLVAAKIPRELKELCTLRSQRGSILTAPNFQDAIVDLYSGMVATARQSQRIQREHPARPQ